MLGLVARQLGTDVTRDSSVWILGAVAESDRAHYVCRVGRSSIEEARQLLTTLSGADAKVIVFEDGLCLIVDRPEAIRRMASVLQDIRNQNPVTWALQLYIVRDARNRLKDVGVDLTPSVELAYTVAGVSAGGMINADVTNQISAGLDSLVRLSSRDSTSSGVWAPVLLMSDSAEAEYSDSTSVLVPQYVTDPQTGRVTETGFTTVSAGLVIKGSVRETGTHLGRLTLSVDLKGIDSYVGVRPVVSGKSLTTTADIRDGGLYLFGEVAGMDHSESKAKLLQWGSNRVDSGSSVSVWGRFSRLELSKMERLKSLWANGQAWIDRNATNSFLVLAVVLACLQFASIRLVVASHRGVERSLQVMAVRMGQGLQEFKPSTESATSGRPSRQLTSSQAAMKQAEVANRLRQLSESLSKGADCPPCQIGQAQTALLTMGTI